MAKHGVLTFMSSKDGTLPAIHSRRRSRGNSPQLGLRKRQLAGSGRAHSNGQPIQLPENRDAAAGGLSPRHSCPLFAAAAWTFGRCWF